MTSVPQRHVIHSRRRFLQTYRHVALLLQLLSGIATTATFVRISEQYRLPAIFLALPSLLLIITVVGRCIPQRDAAITAIVIGAVTGAIAGFLSAVVGHGDLVTKNDVKVQRSNAIVFVCSLEFLHIPVVVGTVMYTFCLLFTRLPPLTLIIIAAATAACGTVIVGIGLVIINDPVFTGTTASSGSFSSTIETSAALTVVFLAVFVLALMPALRCNKRAWLVCAVSLTVSIRWQSYFLDSMQWDWEKSYFPIPGLLVGIVVLFMVDIVELSETADYTTNKISSRHDLSMDNTDCLSTAIMWHIGAYVVERTSLTLILDGRRGSTKSGQEPGGNDAWLCCLGMFGVLGMFAPAARQGLSLLRRVFVLCLGLLLYVCLTATGPDISNGYFLDDILGIALCMTTASSDFVTGL